MEAILFLQPNLGSSYAITAVIVIRSKSLGPAYTHGKEIKWGSKYQEMGIKGHLLQLLKP